jgi:hypothetical protein
MVFIAVAGASTMLASGLSFRFPAKVRDIATISPTNNSGFRYPCFLENAGPSELSQTCIEQGSGPLLFLWGDSTAAALYPGLVEIQKKYEFRIAQFTKTACAPVLGSNGNCGNINTAVLNFVRVSRPSIVLMQAIWDNITLQPVELHTTVNLLREAGVRRIVIVGPVPTWKRSLPNAIVNHYRLWRMIPERLSSGVFGEGSDDFMEQIAKSEGVEYISAWRALCNAEGCLATVGESADDVVTLDKMHLSNKGSRFLVNKIADRLFPVATDSHH